MYNDTCPFNNSAKKKNASPLFFVFPKNVIPVVCA